MLNPAIVVQCFIKVDTLEAVCRSLLQCTDREKFDLIFWNDSPVGSRNPDLYTPAHGDVLALIASIQPECEAAFHSVEVHGTG